MVHHGGGKKEELVTPPQQPPARARTYTGAHSPYRQPTVSPGSLGRTQHPLQRIWGSPRARSHPS